MSARTANSPSAEGAILARLLGNGRGKMSPTLARYILTLGFGPEDQARMAELAERNQEGRLAAAEREELFGYVSAGDLLALLQSKARKTLRSKTRA
ncbi:MAG TPA: hypothetical protein VKD90_12980 [Gemmataceae bacterium]|nr:hypothetical protein [Gemmataceae bacterium]